MSFERADGLLKEDFGMMSRNAIITVPATEAMRSRKFGVYDAMVLIGGLALLFTFNKYDIISLFYHIYKTILSTAAYFGFLSDGPSRFMARRVALYWSSVLWYSVQVSEHLLLCMTPVFLLIRTRKPRPSLRGLLRQPGMVASLAVVFGLIWVTGWLRRLFYGQTHPYVTAVSVGGTVAVAWSVLALSRKWNAEPSWIDRLGRLIGAAAIAVGLLVLMRYAI